MALDHGADRGVGEGEWQWMLETVEKSAQGQPMAHALKLVRPALGAVPPAVQPAKPREWWHHELYSQFGEDGVLMAYFRSKGYGRSGKLDDFGDGFFVDIGAHHPYMLSNTWFFYQLGWRGINVDPTPDFKKKFDAARAEDINLQIAISKEDGEATFYSYGPTVSNTLDSSRVDFSKNPEQLIVQTMRLSTLLDKYVPQGKEISILSVDVEGLDLEVLQSNDWQRYRPELVIAELHESSIAKILLSELHIFMSSVGYILHAWTTPSLIYKRS